MNRAQFQSTFFQQNRTKMCQSWRCKRKLHAAIQIKQSELKPRNPKTPKININSIRTELKWNEHMIVQHTTGNKWRWSGEGPNNHRIHAPFFNQETDKKTLKPSQFRPLSLSQSLMTNWWESYSQLRQPFWCKELKNEFLARSTGKGQFWWHTHSHVRKVNWNYVKNGKSCFGFNWNHGFKI